MYFDYEWISNYLEKAPSLNEAARLLNETGLETEIEGKGLEIEHTVNRPDAMCHFGVARELAVKTNTKLIFPEIDHRELPTIADWQIESQDPHGCWRYMGLLIKGVKNGPSPAWLIDKLDAIEQTAHGTVVDLTNYLLWEMGHPSHAFDANKIKGNTILIRRAKEGEELTTLDGKHHKIGGLLCIADQSDPIALAGVMGGQDSEVDAQTDDLLLELAMFDPVSVRLAAKQTQIQSDAKHRFERGVDEEAMERIIRRFLFLLAKEQPEIEVKGLIDYKTKDFRRHVVHLRKKHLDRILGIELPEQEVAQLLENMDFQPRANNTGWEVLVPGYKVDVSREIDVIEEIIRFAGLDRLPSELPAMAGSDYHPKPEEENRAKMRLALKTCGLQEILTYSFMAGADEAHFLDAGAPLEIRNPMSESSRILRRMILPQMVQVARRNMARGQKNFKFFEMGHVFKPHGEVYNLACMISQPKDLSTWGANSTLHPIFEMKGILASLMEEIGCFNYELHPKPLKGFDPEICLEVQINDQPCGRLGALHPQLMEQLGIDVPNAILELECDFLKQHQPQFNRSFELSPFPNMEIDMAFVLDASIPFEKVHSFIESQKLPNLESMCLFDVYSGRSLEKGKKSLGFRFTFRASDRTLTSDEVHEAIQAVSQKVIQEFQATIRS